MNVVIDNFQNAEWWFSWGMKNYEKAEVAFHEYDPYLAKLLSERAVEDLTVFKMYQNNRGVETPSVDLYIKKSNELAHKSDNVILVTKLTERLLNLTTEK